MPIRSRRAQVRNASLSESKAPPDGMPLLCSLPREIWTARLILRVGCERDLSSLIAATSDLPPWHWQPERGPPRPRSIHWILGLPGQEACIGCIGLSLLGGGARIAEMGCVLHPGRSDRGFAAEAETAVLECGFGQAGLDAIVVAAADDACSRRILRELGLAIPEALRSSDTLWRHLPDSPALCRITQEAWRRRYTRAGRDRAQRAMKGDAEIVPLWRDHAPEAETLPG
jgi:RimJ/RimL family protein N-acetyltransferase